MPLYVDDVEAAWIAVNIATAAIMTGLLLDARQDYRWARRLGGEARILATRGAVIRMAIKLVVVGILCLAVIPGLFSDRDLSITGPIGSVVGLLMLVAVLLLLLAISDVLTTRAVGAAVAREWRHRQVGPPTP